MENYIYKLAEIADAIKYDNLSPKIIEKAKICIIDDLECCMNNMNDERGAAALSSVPKDNPGNGSTIFGQGHLADAADAAYVNTVKACIAVRNDTSMIAVCHPGTLIVPVVLALAEENKIPGKRIIEAIVAGYETMIRFGTLLDGKMNPAWRYTAVFGPVGAAFAASKLMGLSIDEMASAASFACHSCGGVNQWAISGTGDDVFQNSAGARNGIFSMRLAKGGAKACPSIIEGRTGIGAAFGVTEGFDILTKKYDEYLIGQVMHKPITSCVFVQNPCQATAELLRRHPEINKDNIEKMEAYVNTAAYTLPGTTNNEYVNSITNAVMSIPYGIASTIVDRSDEHLNFVPPFDEEAVKLMHSCTVIEEKNYPPVGIRDAKISITLKNGNVHEYESPALTPLTNDEVRQLFLKTCSPKMGQDKAQAALDYMNKLENVDDCHIFTDLMR